MRNFLVLFFISCNLTISGQLNYWENLSLDEQHEIICSGKVSKNILDLYNAKFIPSDNEETIALLKTLSNLSANTKLKSLYFYLFNQICKYSDGGLSELLGKYCMEVILSDPKYVLLYMNENPLLLKKYIDFLGSEFYYKEGENSDIKYNFDDFRQIISEQLGQDEEYQIVLSALFSGIENKMIKME